MCYRLVRPLLFLLPPEVAHKVALASLKVFYQLGLLKYFVKKPATKPVEVFGLEFTNPIGIAAGLDKDGDYIDCLAALGVGFIEVGAVTPQPQPGNPKPRLHRVVEHQSLINRMGFNNRGVDYLVRNLRRRKTSCIIGVNLGKNKNTPLKQAKNDYCYCLEKIYPVADFATINISSPNTEGLRDLQGTEYLEDLLRVVYSCREQLAKQHQKALPLLVKLAPDLTEQEVKASLEIAHRCGMDGIIATNTTQDRQSIAGHCHADKAGGLSGQAITERSRLVTQWLTEHHTTLPVISVGGIEGAAEAQQRFAQGASLIQVYTGLIYQGPGLIGDLLKTIQ